MTVDTLIMLAGAFVAALPFLGFPNAWDSVLFLITGVFVIALGIVVRRRGKRFGFAEQASRDAHFVEHIPETNTAHGQS